jgi:uncharacterized protein YjiS (DUF1127 family)
MIHCQSVAPPPGMRLGRGSIHPCVVCARLRELVDVWMARRRLRRQLLDYMATDHRAPSDLRMTEGDAAAWAMKPFWRE